MKTLIFDGFSLLFRGFYALPALTNSKGAHTNAIYGFLNMFFRFVQEEDPQHVVVAFDLPQPTFRHHMYGAYKGTRRAMPDELREQVPVMKALLEKMGITIAQAAGFEADDVIGTLARQAQAAGHAVVVVSGDRDLLQIATDAVQIRLPRTKGGKQVVESYFAADIVRQHGYSAAAIVEIKALMGDKSDNIPGVPGIGEVTAAKIIAQYGTVEAALLAVDDIKPARAAQNLREHAESARISRELARIRTDAPITFAPAPCADMYNARARAEVVRLELRSLYKRFGVDAADIAIAPEPSTVPAADDPPPDAVRYIEDAQQIDEFFASLCDASEPVCVHIAQEAGTLAIGIKQPGRGAVCIRLAGSASPDAQMSLATPPPVSLPGSIKSWLASAAPKVVYDTAAIAGKHGIAAGFEPGGVCFDAMLAAYVLDAADPCKDIRDLSERFLPHVPADADVAALVCALEQLRGVLDAEIAAGGQTDLYYTIEAPLTPVLQRMERAGILVDAAMVRSFGAQFAQQLETLRTQIIALAGCEFNINSPKQLADVLYDKLGLASGKRTKTGRSTAADVLEKIRGEHAIVAPILEYRALAKLIGTYVDGLLEHINPRTGRVHAVFHQRQTSTGRLSCAEPNLQNIPIRTALGAQLRKAFVPQAGMVFVVADYSQIELRLLAHISEDAALVEAFATGQDIHTQTAAWVLGKPAAEITPQERSRAKAVNFGICYGISAYGLSADLDIPVHQAKEYIDGYFAKYPGVQAFMQRAVREARADGMAHTIFGRRRRIAQLHSKVPMQRAFGERAAMNMPIQGSAADIIKIAMLRVDERLRRDGLQTQLLLQVHDELLLEAPAHEADRVRELVKTEMEAAAALRVPLVANVQVGSSWYEAK